MPEPEGDPPDRAPRASDADGVGEALRAAVERTLSATADSATGAGQRAQSLLDDVVRRGQEARDEVARRGEGATARLAEAIGELRSAETAEVERLRSRVEELERRLASVESQHNPLPEGETNPPAPHEKGDPGG